MVKQKFTATMDEHLLERIKIQAIKEKTSVSALIEKLVSEYLAKCESATTPRAD